MRYLDAARLLRFKRNINSVESFGDAIRFTQRTLPGKKKLNSVRLARQNSGNFAILSWDFLRKFCNISTPDAFLFGSKRNFDLIKSFISVFTRFAHRTLAECTNFSCARRAEIPEIYQNLRDLDAARLLFYGSERTVDSNESAGEAIRFTQRALS